MGKGGITGEKGTLQVDSCRFQKATLQSDAGLILDIQRSNINKADLPDLS